MSVTVFVLFIFVFLIGLCDILHTLHLLLIKPKSKPEQYLVLRLSGENDFCELNYCIEKMKWQGKFLAEKLVCIKKDNTDDADLYEFADREVFFINESEFNAGIFITGEKNGESGDSRNSHKNYISQP